MDKNLIIKIIQKFLEGNCSDEEFSYLLYWYETFDENMPLPISEEEKERLRTSILRRIKSNIPELTEPKGKAFTQRKAVGKRKVWRVTRYAVAAAIAALIVWGSINYFSPRPHSLIISKQMNQKKYGMVSISNHSDQVHLLYLPDSSKVWMNPGSEVLYPEKFNGKERKLQLLGDAFFDIKHNPGYPFVVSGGDLIATVLGTSFLFRTDAKYHSEVTVMSGKVAVSMMNKKREKIILTAKQSVVLGQNNQLVKEVKGDSSDLQRWQNISLRFNNVPFIQVMQILDKKFGVQMYCLDDKINQYQLNADFDDQNLAAILEMLGMSLNIRYKMINDSTISFYTIHEN